MNYLLDTCVISELVKATPNGNVMDWINHTPSERLFLSVITIGEIRKGITKLPNSKKKYRLTNWLNTLLENYEARIYPVDLTVAESWGNIQGKAENNGTPVPSVDSLIGRIPIFPVMQLSMKYVNLPFVSNSSSVLLYSMIVA